MSSSALTFRLPDNFVEPYEHRPVPWGFGILSEITFLRTYSRKKDDGTKETWTEVCRRVIEGMYSIQKNHCLTNRLPWFEDKAIRSAEEAFDRMWNFKWTPPGRGLWVMGTDFVHARHNSAALQNCAYTSTAENFFRSMSFLMEASMLGVGVGFDTKGAGSMQIQRTSTAYPTYDYIVPDTREGWCESTEALLRFYLDPESGHHFPTFDYSRIRPEGEPIRGFGGTAAGPEPLIELHNQIERTFDGRFGDKVTATDIADIGNLIGKCVVAGNVRRSAEILLGEPTDEFLALKDPVANPERNDWEKGWAQLSNNSVIAEVGNTNYAAITERVATNGEPGIFWLDLARNYGRLEDDPDGSDYRAMGTNPCVREDAWVQTTEGPRQVRDLIGHPFWAVVDGKAYQSKTGMYPTRVADVYRLTTDEGYELELTGNHEVRTIDGKMVAAEDLAPGDKICINNHREVTRWTGAGSFGEGELLGAFIGDGGWESAPVVKVWSADDGSAGVQQALLEAASALPRRKDWSGWRDHGRGYLSMSLSREMLAQYGVTRDTGKNLSSPIERTSSEFHQGFLRGLFDADGHVEGWTEEHRDAGLSVRLSSSRRDHLAVVQRMLLRLGIRSKIRGLKPSGVGVIRGEEFSVSETWRLIVSSSDVQVFADRVGFSNTEKAERLAKGLLGRTTYNKPWAATVVSFEYVTTEQVYDCTVEDIHLFDANGFVVSNCGEQTLESFECCTLVETYPTRHENLDDYLRTLKFAYMYAKAVTLLPTHWEETNAIMQRNRRIGTSMTGIAQFVEQHTVTELWRWQDAGYQEIQRWDDIYSEWLCVRESIKTTSVKPSGTVSLLAGVTPGAHWPTYSTYLRRMRVAANDPVVEVCRASGYTIEPEINDPLGTVVIEFPVKLEGDVRTESQVSVWEKVSLVAGTQRWWADNQVSATATFRKDEVQDLAAVLRAHEGALKSISLMPILEEGDISAYAQLPYEAITDEEYERAVAKLRDVDTAPMYGARAEEAVGEKFCSNDTCEVAV